MSIKRIMTLEQLTQFCLSANFSKFSSEESGYELSVSIPAEFYSIEENTRGMLMCDIRVCHTNLNRNHSYISEENMTKAMPTLKYRPFLASFTTDEDGNVDFDHHNMEIVEDEEGNQSVNYIEKQIGCFTADEPYLEYDKEKDKTYVVAKVAIPEEYTEAANVIRRKNGTKVSCELNIEKMSYNAKEGYLELEDFYFSGCTALGEHVMEGMAGSRLDIADFSSNNSVFSHIEENTKLIESISELTKALNDFNKNNNFGKEDIQMDKEIKVVEEVTTEEVTTEEVTEESTEEVTDTEDVSEDTVEDTPTDDEVTEDNNTEEFSDEPMVRTYEISHDDIRYALYNLISIYDDDWYSIEAVYDDKFIMYGWDNGNYYGQKYTKDGDSVLLDGERYALFAEFLTETEKAELESMRASYSSIKEKADKYDYSVLEAERVAEFEKEDYSSIKDKNEFIELAKEENHKDFSLDEVREKLNEIILSYAKAGQLNFSSVKPEKGVKVTRLPINDKSTKKSRYGSLFSK